MNIPRYRSIAGLLAMLVLPPILSFPVHGAPAPAGSIVRGPAATVAAANAFLGTLDEKGKARVLFAFEDAAQRKRWSNLPSGIFERAGLRLADLTKPQRDAAMALLAAVLSPEGYEKVVGIMEGDETLTKNTPPGGRIVFGRDEYFISFLGTPSAEKPWEIQFGGHHLALNITLVGSNGTLAPSHTAAQPASFTLEGRTVRPLGRENDLAFELINSLDATQRRQAVIGAQFRDLVMGPTQEVKTLVPEGVKVSSFNASQRGQLMELVRQWVGILAGSPAEAKMAEVKAGLDATWFAWSGPTAPGSAAYFRIQGPALFIEYAPQSLGGQPTQHIHTMYRDPSNEFGVRWLKP